MKTRILTQAQKQHNVNALHDAFIAASVVPIHVESVETESRFSFMDSVQDSAIDAVIASYTFVAPAVPVDLRAAWQSYKSAVNGASTVAQIKGALTNELGVLLKELFRSRDGGLGTGSL